MEIVAAIVHQLTRNLTPEQVVDSGFGPYYIDHTTGIWPQAAGGIPQNACEFQSKGDPITDLVEDMAAEQKARSTYDNILRVITDPEICDPIRFLREREIVHFQRFGEALCITHNLKIRKAIVQYLYYCYTTLEENIINYASFLSVFKISHAVSLPDLLYESNTMEITL